MVSQTMKEFLGDSSNIGNYSMEDGGILISMESTMALNEIYDLEYQMEAVQVMGAIQAKETGIPITEGIASAARSFAGKMSDWWKRIKEWFEKLRKKLKQWFTDITLRITGMFKDPVKWVDKNKGFITGADPEAFRADIKTYKYTNMYNFMLVMSRAYTDVTTEYRRLLETEIDANHRSTQGDSTGADAVKHAFSSRGSQNFSGIKKQFFDYLKVSEDVVDKDGISKYAFGYFRNGAQSSDDKIVPDKIDMTAEVQYVLETKNRVKDIKEAGTTIDTVLNFYQKKIDEWSKGSAEVNSDNKDVVSDLTKNINTIQTLFNAFVSAYVTALQERATTAFKICKKGAFQANKSGEGR